MVLLCSSEPQGLVHHRRYALAVGRESSLEMQKSEDAIICGEDALQMVYETLSVTP